MNNQIVIGTLMNICDNPNRVSVGAGWREDDEIRRVPIIVTGNDFSTLYAPLIRDGRMEKFYWQPEREDLVNIVHQVRSRGVVGSRGASTSPQQPGLVCCSCQIFITPLALSQQAGWMCWVTMTCVVLAAPLAHPCCPVCPPPSDVQGGWCQSARHRGVD